MFSNPLKSTAEEYLYTDDNSVRERTKQQLFRKGSNAVAPLIEALISAVIKFDSVGMGKKDMEDFWNAAIEHGVVGGIYADMARENIEQIRQTPDNEDGMSLAQIALSRQAIEHTWQVIEQIGEPAIRALFTLVNGRDKRVRLAALLALSAEENPSRLIINLLVTSAPYHETFSDEPLEASIQWLVGRILVLSGDQRVREMFEQVSRANNITEHEFQEGIIDRAIYLIAKSKK